MLYDSLFGFNFCLVIDFAASRNLAQLKPDIANCVLSGFSCLCFIVVGGHLKRFSILYQMSCQASCDSAVGGFLAERLIFIYLGIVARIVVLFFTKDKDMATSQYKRVTSRQYFK